MMYLRCLRTYKKLLKYVFFILGVIFLGALIGGKVIVSNGKSAVSSMTSNIVTITENTDLSFDSIGDAIMGIINDFTTEEFWANIGDKGLADTTGDLLEKAVSGVVENYTNYFDNIASEIQLAVAKMMTGLMIFVVIQIIALIIGENIVAVLAGREILHEATKGITGTTLNRIVRFVYKLVSIGFVIFMLQVLPVVGIILLIAYPFISCYLAILSRYYLSVKNKGDRSKVLNFKNVFTLFLADLTTIAIAVALSLIVMFVVGGFTAFYLLVSLLAITSVSVRLNAYQFAALG